MRQSLPLCRALSLTLLLAAALGLGPLAPPQAALAKKPAAQAPAEAEAVDISGRIVVGLDKVFIKDAGGFCLVQGQELVRYAGRHVQAKGLVIRQDQEYRTVRLVSYRIQSPDDDSPGAGGAAPKAGKRK